MMRSLEQTSDRTPVSGFVVLSSVLGIFACLGDLAMTRVLEISYPGFKPLLQPMSDLGHTGSPVARVASSWWVVMGLLFVVFGCGFYKAFSRHGRPLRLCAWMIALYGVGEGLGSGLVAGSPDNSFWTPNSLVHNALGAIGMLAVVLLPFFIVKIFDARRSPFLYWYSWVTSVTGIFFIVLFLVSQVYQPEGSLMTCHGLWQRLFVVIYYLFLICLAVLMLLPQFEVRGSPAAETRP